MNSQAKAEWILAPIQPELIQVENRLKEKLQSEVETVTEIAKHIISSGGKRLRPVLTLLSSKLYREQNSRAVQMACIVEYIHTATLLHDDVIDRAELRRNKKSANLLWGNKSSVLVGDFLYCKASSLIAEDGDSRVLAIIAQATSETTEGEVLEIIKSEDPLIDESIYLKIIELKTAKLMGAATQLGALISDASTEDENKMKQFGIELGMAFQLADDALDYSSSNHEIGKSVGIDLKEGKFTLPLLHTLEKSSSTQKELILSAFKKDHFDPEKFEKILSIIKEHEGIEYTLKMAKKHIDSAVKILDSFKDCPAKQSLLAIANYVIERRE